MSYDYSFSLGRIGALEKKLISPEYFYEILKFDFPEGLSKLRDKFFGDLKDFEDIDMFFLKEEDYLYENLEVLLEEKLRIFLKKAFDLNFISKNLNLLNSEYLKKYFLLSVKLENALLDLRRKYLGIKKDLNLRDFPSSFIKEAQSLIDEGKIYLLHFLKIRFLLRFLEEFKKNLLGAEIVFWYFFNKKFQYDILKFIIICKMRKIEINKIKNVLEVSFGK